jgi:hypothetical protein
VSTEGSRRADPVHADELRIVPANHATCHDVEAIFGTADYPFHCQCQRFEVAGWLWRDRKLSTGIANIAMWLDSFRSGRAMSRCHRAHQWADR